MESPWSILIKYSINKYSLSRYYEQDDRVNAVENNRHMDRFYHRETYILAKMDIHKYILENKAQKLYLLG
jgi:hypothetical protein